MPSYVTPKKNTAFTFYTALTSQADATAFQANPTLAAGDVQVSTDGGAFANLATLPVVTPALGASVKVDLSAAEMNGDNIAVQFIDAAGDEWNDQHILIQTTAGQIDDLPTAAEVWSATPRTLTQTAASVQDAIDGTSVTRTKSTTWSIALTGLGDISTRTGEKLLFTIKRDTENPDAEALLQIGETTGLITINGATAGTAGNGSITVDDASAGDITIALTAGESANLRADEYWYDVKWINASSEPLMLSGPAKFTVALPVTLATS